MHPRTAIYKPYTASMDEGWTEWLLDDYGFPYTPHGTYARDLWIFVKILGFSAMDTIVAATRHGGELMGRPGELGIVKVGALADLLLVDGDPLADIAVLQDRGALRMIMKDGALHKAPEKGRS